ncbi:MAG: TonB-dependent receptor plug domain-containing protein, partial [Bacteroidales bacterium]|nr:TonB-dependent receptor plug domain-containing protein [Bacteroidales bacterium]
SLCSFQLVAQDAIADTIILLNEISINTFRFEQFAEGSKQQSIDSAAKQSYGSGTVAEALSGFTTLYLKSYGISGNTGISLRGTTSSQTAILWNGINLQDPLNGASNLELMPLNAVDEINVQFGGSGALYGSGAIGGAILLQSKAILNSGIKGSASIGIGSFGLRFVNGSFHFGKEKIASALRIFYREAENDFPFVNTQQFGHPEIKQTNAAFQTQGISQDNTLKIAKHQLLSTHFWVQKTERELPPSMTTLQSSQMQSDESIRFSADHSYTTSKWTWMSKMAFLSAKLNYNDSTNRIYAEHRSQSTILESEFAYRLNTNHLVNIGAHNRTDWGFSENFGETNHRNTFAILLSYKYANSAKTLNLAASIRQEIIDSKMVIPTPSLGWNYNLNTQIRIDGKFSRNYRQPT